jgi:hypothetical protein
MISKFYINEDLSNKVEQVFTQRSIPWYYNSSTYDATDEEVSMLKTTTVDSPQFVHILFDDTGINSPFFEDSISVLKESFDFNTIDMLRAKSNMTLNVSGYTINHHQPIHTDGNPNVHKTFIYYVNDTDGDTMFFDKDLNIIERITPKKGMGILFDSDIRHAAQNPIKHYQRVVLNFVWKWKV